jgi:hypothetical protein
MTLPPLPETFYGENVTVKIDVNELPKRKSRLDEICDGWKDDERSTEEIIRDIYEARTAGICSFEELCGVWGKEEDREDVDRMVAAIHEGRLLGTEREPL